LKVVGEYRSGCLRVGLSGELDHHSVAETMLSVEREIERYLPKDCALDFRDVTFMDSSGIALILRLRRRMLETGGRICVVGTGMQPGKVMAAAGLDRIVPIEYKEMRKAT